MCSARDWQEYSLGSTRQLSAAFFVHFIRSSPGVFSVDYFQIPDSVHCWTENGDGDDACEYGEIAVLFAQHTEYRYTVSPEPLRVLIADDNAHVRAGFRALLSTWPEVEIVGEVQDGQQAVRFVEERKPRVVLMDVRMPNLDGVQATQLIKHRWPDVWVVIITINIVEQSAALAAGADAFVVKGEAPDQLRVALQAAITVGTTVVA